MCNICSILWLVCYYYYFDPFMHLLHCLYLLNNFYQVEINERNIHKL